MKHAEQVARGRAIRAAVPRSSLATHRPVERDALAIIEAQNATRLPELVALRMQRMTASPFAFYRGTAAIMAADLADAPSTGIRVVSCGDAHVSNFGVFASPQRTLVFDLNDFDEAAIAPWEWDLKRLVTSVVIGARDIGLHDKATNDIALATAASYRTTLAELVELSVLDRYFRVADVEQLRAGVGGYYRQFIDKTIKQARKRTSAQAVARMSRVDDAGNRRFVEDPPVLTRLSDDEQASIVHLFDDYRETVPGDIALLLSQYEIADIALRVVGVGSVGTRCFVLLLTGPAGESLVLQVKEALPSVLHSWGGVADAAAPHDGQRVVTNQRILQAVSDPFLGFLTGAEGRHFYVRQFRDMKGSVDLETLSERQFATYAAGCASVLARAHSQSPEAPTIVGYLGSSGTFDRAIVEWSTAYADQSLEDFTAVSAAIRQESPQ